MDETLEQLKQAGIHYLKSKNGIILEIIEERVEQVSEMDRQIDKLLSEPERGFIVLECPKSILSQLTSTKEKMQVVGERVIYTKDLSDTVLDSVPTYEVWSPTEAKSVSFLAEVMNKSINETEKFLATMRAELPLQMNNMFTVLIMNHDPVGVVFPHIEPNTVNQGRIFWIGIHPKFIGRGLGKGLHRIGLYRLQHDFKAVSYLGATKIDNEPMRKILSSNGCTEKTAVISLESVM
ncbi:GNAT family N-acetyltransferase [Ornithinibacillus xuwenensis]|uniref:GNAT family N-acetyltransferase n=1 Tax=Ornithinibacillus xuwenensis TaxID=3144668 RepID=A0ABU9XL41_9BACI